MTSLPRPLFSSCDETSLRLKSEFHNHKDDQLLYIEYKLPAPNIDWDQAKRVLVKKDNSIILADLVDLEPGTAYQVRFTLRNAKDDTVIENGPATVYDTKPIDCGPKGKSCIIL